MQEALLDLIMKCLNSPRKIVDSFLNNKLAPKSLVDIPLWVFVSINNDMHYTQYNEIYCDKHHDLLAAGDM